MMAPYIPAARRRPVFSAAGPSWAPSPAAMLVMAAPSGQYTPAGAELSRHRVHNGASVKRVQLALGHSTPIITLNTHAGGVARHRRADAFDRGRRTGDVPSVPSGGCP